MLDENMNPVEPIFGEQPAEYEPTPEQLERISQVKIKFERMRTLRQPHERQWFINSAFERAQQYVDWSVKTGTVDTPDAPAHRIRLVANRILPKMRARRAKFVKNRPTWIVVAATPDQNDKMNARATQKVLDYQWRRLKLEMAHIEAMLWAEVSGRGYWWIFWDSSIKGRVKMEAEIPNMPPTIEEAILGDVAVEVSGPFEVLIGDPTKVKIGDQPEIMRVKMRDIEEMKKRFPMFANYIKPTAEEHEIFTYERQISTLNSAGFASFGRGQVGGEKGGKGDRVLVIELMQRPGPDMPDGHYSLLVGDVLVEDRAELPYGFADLPNPYPVVEFMDTPIAGQYWSTTLIEQLIGIQREYNLIRSKIAEQMRLQLHPKILVATQHQLNEDAWTSEAGEIVEYVARPGIPPPQVIEPPSIATDAWRGLELIQKEFEDLTQIYPTSEGRAGTANSGFQTNLLQEATDAVHSTDVRLHELAIEEAGIKFRRLMKNGYTIPRMITAIGKDYEPDVIEFSNSQIDENADIIIEAGSGLPNTKWAKIDAVMKMYQSGVMGDQQDPDVRRRVLSMMELGSTEEAYDFARRDIDKARIENTKFVEGKPVDLPTFYDNHQIHYQIHCDQLKSAELEKLPQVKQALTIHVIKHSEFINPSAAFQLATELGLQKILKPSTIQLMMAPPPPPMGPAGGGGGMGRSPQAPGPQAPAGPPAPPGMRQG